MSQLPDVAIVGGGAIGASIAFELAQRGASVVVLERGPQLAWGCSAGNAGIVGASHVLPLAGPEALRDGVRWLGRPDSPFGVRPRPGVVPWLMRFAAASLPSRVRHARAVLRALALDSARMHANLAAAGLTTGYTRRGLMNVYAGERAFAAAAVAAREDRDDGLEADVLDRAALVDALPDLSSGPAGGVLYRQEAHCDPTAFVRAVGEAAVANGAAVRTGVEVLGIQRRNGDVESLLTTAGDVRAGQYVLAAGAWSRTLADGLPLELPVEGGKGYHVDVEARPGDPDLPVWFHEDRVVVTPLSGRLRVAGTLELTGVDERVDQRRLNAVVRAAATGLRSFRGRAVKDVWRGLRPCSPDGLPIVGPVPELSNLLLATGHGMWGLQLAPVTGVLVAQLVAGVTPAHDVGPLRPDRFEHSFRSFDPSPRDGGGTT